MEKERAKGNGFARENLRVAPGGELTDQRSFEARRSQARRASEVACTAPTTALTGTSHISATA